MTLYERPIHGYWQVDKRGVQRDEFDLCSSRHREFDVNVLEDALPINLTMDMDAFSHAFATSALASFRLFTLFNCVEQRDVALHVKNQRSRSLYEKVKTKKRDCKNTGSKSIVKIFTTRFQLNVNPQERATNF